MGWRSSAARRPTPSSHPAIHRETWDLPQPVRAAHTAITGRREASMVCRGPSSTKSAPVASDLDAACMTSAWETSL